MPLPPTLKAKNLPKTLEAKVPRKAARDLRNRMLFGRDAPKSDECIYVDPRRVRQAYHATGDRTAPRFRRKHSGLVLGGNWDQSVQPWGTGIKERACELHFRDGVSWQDTGVIDHLLADIERKGSSDGCHSLEELQDRYRALDRLYEEIRRIGRLKPRSELENHFRREHGGIYIHIGRDGTPIKAGGGIHRLIISRILGLKKIPVQLGVIHEEAVREGLLQELRKPA